MKHFPSTLLAICTSLTLITSSCSRLVAQSASTTTAKGIVYEDRNRNGRRDFSEKGIAGIRVSNGIDVTVTDARGRYTLPITDDDILFVIKPAGYGILLDEFNKPKFYYIHKPKGSPTFKYEGVSPTGKLPRSVDFGLIKMDEPTDFSFFAFGDTQTYTEEELDFLRRGVVREASQIRGPRFGITLGDLVGDHLELHPGYKSVMAGMGMPWYHVMGNHDMNYDAKSDKLSDETFEKNFGPNNYSFDYGKAHFIILDDIYYPHPITGKGYWAGFREDQLKFVENDLKHVDPSNLVVISMHIPLSTPEADGTFRPEDRQKLLSLLDSHPNVLFLSAHTHIQYQRFYGKEKGLNREKPIHEFNVGTACGDWYSGITDKDGLPISTMRDGTPKGYAIIHVKDNTYTATYRSYGEDPTYQIRLYLPRVVPATKRIGSFAAYANFFMGTDGDKVECRIDGGEWKPMRQVAHPDPTYSRQVQDWDYYTEARRMRRPSNPIPSPHIWRMGIPANQTPGEHRVEVRATDIYGNTYTQTGTYQVLPVK